jgi:hypothetical protein
MSCPNILKFAFLFKSVKRKANFRIFGQDILIDLQFHQVKVLNDHLLQDILSVKKFKVAFNRKREEIPSVPVFLLR